MPILFKKICVGLSDSYRVEHMCPCWCIIGYCYIDFYLQTGHINYSQFHLMISLDTDLIELLWSSLYFYTFIHLILSLFSWAQGFFAFSFIHVFLAVEAAMRRWYQDVCTTHMGDANSFRIFWHNSLFSWLWICFSLVLCSRIQVWKCWCS